MRAEQNGLGFPEQALFIHFVMPKVGLKGVGWYPRDRPPRRTGALGHRLRPSTAEWILGCARNILINN